MAAVPLASVWNFECSPLRAQGELTAPDLRQSARRAVL